MLRKLLILGAAAGISAAVPTFLQNHPELVSAVMQRVGGEKPEGAGIEAMSLSAPMKASGVSGRKVVLHSDERGHFIAEFKLNGRRVTAMVDTGATLIAMNRSTARSIGIALSATDFKYEIDTANGRARAAAATIPSVDIGRIRLENVEGVVLEDDALSQTLIGMSFLKRLDRYQVQDETLLLSQ